MYADGPAHNHYRSAETGLENERSKVKRVLETLWKQDQKLIVVGL